MNRRRFLKETGLTVTALVVATSAFEALPVAAAPLDQAVTVPVRDLVTAPRLTVTRLTMREAGEYRVSGTIRLEAPVVEISGIANAMQISWSGGPQVVSIQSYEQYDGSGLPPSLAVRGGTVESLTVTPIEYQ